MNYEDFNITIEFLEPMLGTVPKNPDVYAKFIADKTKNLEDAKEEIKTVQSEEATGWTGFHSDDNGIFIYNYMIKGFVKASIETLTANKTIKKIPAYKKWVDRMVHVRPRCVYFNLSEPDGYIERPIRVNTPKGERVSVVRSDTVNPGRQISFTVRLLTSDKNITKETIEAVFCEGGEYGGLGQWRGSGGYGCFKVVTFDQVVVK